jgi:hypothetical protein
MISIIIRIIAQNNIIFYVNIKIREDMAYLAKIYNS